MTETTAVPHLDSRATPRRWCVKCTGRAVQLPSGDSDVDISVVHPCGFTVVDADFGTVSRRGRAHLLESDHRSLELALTGVEEVHLPDDSN